MRLGTAPTQSSAAMTFDETWHDEHRSRLPSAATFATVGALLSLLAAAFVLQHMTSALNTERGLRNAEIDKLKERMASLEARNRMLSGRVGSAEQAINQRDSGVASLARRALRSVFTVETAEGLGSGFVGWRDSTGLYVVTANHVVNDDIGGTVTLTRGGKTWNGEVSGADPKNDLAVIRVEGFPPGAAPLWQRPYRRLPRIGDQLLLVGSPFGLSGTVTTGVISRITRQTLQTDAAANPGNSGGPAIDRRGRVVGVLVAGGGENINFAIRIDRACVRIRHC
jgi:S1-C subfamily serine protease